MTRARVLLAIGALAAAACGGGSDEAETSGGEVPAGRWARTVCTGLADWSESVAQASASVPAPADPAAARDAITALLDTLVGATEDALETARDAGVPDVRHGGEIARFVIDGFDAARASLVSGRERLGGASASDPVALRAAIQAAQSSAGVAVSEALDGVERAVGRYDVPALVDAIREEPACQAVT